MLQAPEVIGAYGFGGLDFDADDLARGPFEYAVDFDPISISVVIEPYRLLGPRELAGQLAKGEVLDQRTRGCRYVGHSGRGQACQMGAKPGVDQQQFGGRDRACGRVGRPKLLESGKIPFRLIGKHRRITYEDLQEYRRRDDAKHRSAADELAALGQEPDI